MSLRILSACRYKLESPCNFPRRAPRLVQKRSLNNTESHSLSISTDVRIRMREAGFGVVEIIIAALMLAAVISGLALAVNSSSKLQSRASSNSRMQTAAQRVFEKLRSDTSWMESCTTIGNDCDLRSKVDDSTLEDSELGAACNGSGTYRHELVTASATPIDSDIDGLGDNDKDGNIPDYFKIVVVISAPECAQARLGTQKATFVSAIDRRGRVPKGSLTVEVCVAQNQIDDRASIAGCAPGSGGAFKMGACPPPSDQYIGTPAERCNGAWDWVKDKDSSTTAPTPFVGTGRATANFAIVDMSGATVASSSDATSPPPGPGLYEFPELPAGTYRIVSITPTGAAAGMSLWETKLIPAVDPSGNSAGVIVQPDQRSTALLTFQPSRVGKLDLTFKREVETHNVKSVSTPEMLAERFIQTSDWEGDPEILMQAIQNHLSIIQANEMFCGWLDNICNTKFVLLDGVGVNGSGDAPGQNCIRFGSIISVTDKNTGKTKTTEKVQNTCTRYDLYVQFEYDTTESLPNRTLDGAPLGATYATMPMPTFRAMVPSSETPGSQCTVSNPLPVFGGRTPLINQDCVDTRSASNFVVNLGPFVPGLHAGIAPYSGPVSTAWGTDFLDDDGGAWTTARNESKTPIPSGLKQAMFVHRDGTIETPDGQQYPPNTNLTVVGKGECYWRYNMGSSHMGSCNPCEPYIEPLSGTFPSCYILRKVTWRRHVYYTGGWADDGVISGSWDEHGSTNTTQVCAGAPLPGNHIKTAPNCTPLPPSPPRGGGGGSTSPGSIPAATVHTSYGSVRVPATGIGG